MNSCRGQLFMHMQTGIRLATAIRWGYGRLAFRAMRVLEAQLSLDRMRIQVLGSMVEGSGLDSM